MTEYMEKFSVSPSDRRASGIRRLRRGRSADRGRAPQAVQRRAVRRGRKGAPGCVQHPAADPRRRPHHRFSQGRTVDFKNTIIILTSNLGAASSCWTASSRTAASPRAHGMPSWASCAASFRPEFLNRLDEIILFKPLTKENLSGIIEILMQGLRQAHGGQDARSSSVTDAAKSLIIEQRLRSDLRRAPAEALPPERGGDADREGDPRAATCPPAARSCSTRKTAS